MYDRDNLKQRAEKAIDKTGAIGSDIDLNDNMYLLVGLLIPAISFAKSNGSEFLIVFNPKYRLIL